MQPIAADPSVLATAWHALTPEAAAERLAVAPELGLSPAEVAARQARYGPNRLSATPGPGLLRRLLAQLRDVTVLALLGAAVISVVLSVVEGGERTFLEQYGDALAILAIVILNAVLGLVQESRAERALKALQDMTAPEAEALRGGRVVRVPAAELVPGDVVLLEDGTHVPADLRLLRATRLTLLEAPLTGESHPIDKQVAALTAETALAERRCMAYLGTAVGSGLGRGLVVATGMETELGHIAGMLAEVQAEPTPLQRSLQRFGLRIVIGCVVISALIFAFELWRTDLPVGFLFLTAVSLAVAAIPEGLPAITTIVLALGVQRMAARNAVVRKLSAVEALGAAQVICTDKTGTLTQNRMAARSLWAGGQAQDLPPTGAADGPSADGRTDGSRASAAASWSGAPPFGPLLAACRWSLAADLTVLDGQHQLRGDPTDGALLLLHHQHGDRASPDRLIDQLPFDSDRKLATALVAADDGPPAAITHGAWEAVLARCTRWLDAGGQERALAADTRAALERLVADWGEQGLRVLGFGRRALSPADSAAPTPETIERDLTLLGLVGLHDPPRPEVAAAIATARRAGVRSVMITGDHPRTGAAIGRSVGLLEPGDEILTGAELETLDDAALTARAGRIGVLARATPAHKLRLVRSLMGQGKVTAMTGDGVNDAPALKAASIGIAMGKIGTDVAREAAAMVLADDNYATIVAAIDEGRRIYDNIKRFIVFLLSINVGLVLAVFVAALLGWPPLLTPTQILWINLVTNGLPALALGMEPVHVDPMGRPPRDPAEPLLLRAELLWLSAYGVLMGALGLAVFWYYHEVLAAGLPLARTMVFGALALMPLFHALTCRSQTGSLLRIGFFTNRALLWAFALAFALQALATWLPPLQPVFRTASLGPLDVALVLGLGLAIWLVGDLEKAVRWLARRRRPA